MFDPAILAAFQADAAARFPQEACGVITAEGYVPLPNLAADPTQEFELGPEGAQLLLEGRILAVVHSHPGGPDEPSLLDQQQQIAMDVPWGLCTVFDGEPGPVWFWGEGHVPPPPLMPRDYRMGPSGTDGRGDCLALVRDWYRLERKLAFPEIARDRDWLLANPNAYLDGLLASGFEHVTLDQLAHGDIVLMAIQSGGRANHAGVYLEGGYLLHHLQNRLVARESFAFWRGCAVAMLRYHGSTP